MRYSPTPPIRRESVTRVQDRPGPPEWRPTPRDDVSVDPALTPASGGVRTMASPISPRPPPVATQARGRARLLPRPPCVLTSHAARGRKRGRAVAPAWSPQRGAGTRAEPLRLGWDANAKR